MSTKTTFKRIALVAVAALGFGGLTSVTPASAAVTTPTAITIGTIGAARSGSETFIPVSFTMPSFVAGTDTFTVAVKVTSAPTGSQFRTSTSPQSATYYTLDNTNGARLGIFASTAASTTGVSATYAPTSASTTTDLSGYAVYTTQSSSTSPITLQVRVKPDVSGSYTFLVSVGNTSWTAGDLSTSFTLTTAAAPSSIVLSSVNSGTNTGAQSADNHGSLIKVTLKDSAGSAALPGSNEAIVLSSSSSTGTFAKGAAPTTGAAATVALSSTDFTNGVAYVHAYDTTAGTATVTAAGNGLLSSIATTNTNITFAATSTAAAVTVGLPSTTTTGYADYAAGTPNDLKKYASTALSSHTLRVSYDNSAGTSAFKTRLTVTDTSGKITGISTGEYSLLVSIAAGDKYADVAIPATLSNGNSFRVEALTSATTNYTSGLYAMLVEGQTRAATSITLTPSVIASAAKATNTIRALVKDQFGSALANSIVAVSVAGRNPSVVTTNLLTDSTGYVSYSLTDGGTVAVNDTVTFTGGDANNAATAKSASINYSAAAVSTVTVTGGASADVAPAKTWSPISSGDIGAGTTGAVAFTATVKDANGNLLAGVPVTFTVDKGLILKTSTIDYTTVYTGADGTAVTYAFNWITEKQTVTATAGGKTGTGYANWRSETASQARSIAATVDSTNGNVVTFTVKDRFGNGVRGANVTLSRVGTGFFFGGASTSSATTGSDGTVAVQFTGAGDVTGTLDTTTEGYDVAGQVQATALKAAVAGTTTGTGVSFSTAGVGTATVAVTAGSDSATTAAQAANDAAAEATDAANAATDAANAAAEAADAATAAAQDAADAVAALSTQVGEMIDALKKQITALTNLVIKIQKKVKA